MIIRIMQGFGVLLGILGCYMVDKHIMAALVIAYAGLSIIFTSIQIEERYADDRDI